MFLLIGQDVGLRLKVYYTDVLSDNSPQIL